MKVEGLRFLITGGTGFIGAAIAKDLARRGGRVRIFDDNSRGAARRLGDALPTVESVTGDIRDREAVTAATSGCDVVCHLAFVNGTEHFYSRPALVLDVGVNGIANVLHACQAHAVRRFILASSSEVYQTPPIIPTPEDVPLIVPDPLNARYSYCGGKIISELMAINYGRTLFDELFIFRPHNVFGPDMGWEHVIPQFITRMVALARSQTSGRVRFPIQGTGSETRAYVYIDDFVDGFFTMLRGEPGIYNIGSMEEITVRHLAVMVARSLGREVDVVEGPLQPGSTPRRCPDISKLRRLGFEPRVPLIQALSETVRWYADNIDWAPRN